MPAPESAVETKTPRIQIRVTDGLHERGAWMLKRQQVFSDSIRVKLDGVAVSHQYLRAKDLIVIKLKKPLSNGVHFVETALINYYGNHNLPGGQWFKVAPPATRMELRAWTDTIPPDKESYVGITVTAFDKDGMPIADDEPIHARTSLGRLAEPMQLSQSGVARFYLHSDVTPRQSGVARVEVAYKDKREAIPIRFGEIDGGIVQGSVHDSLGSALAEATVRLEKSENGTARTDPNGHFFFKGIPPGIATLHVSKSGYYNARLKTAAVSNSARILRPVLHPIGEGAFIGQVFVLDARYGGKERGTPVNDSLAAADLNLALVKSLKEMLELAGVTVYLIRETDQHIPVSRRVAAVNAIKREGYYLRLDHGIWVAGEPAVIAAGYPGNQVAETYLKAILAQFNIALFETPIETVGDSESPEIRWTNKPALSLEIRSIKHPHLDGPVDSPARISREAYAIFLGTLQFLKEPALSQTQLEVQIVSSSSRQPVAGARVALDGTFPLVTDLAGKVVFRRIQPRRYRVVIQTAGEASQEIEVDWVNRSTSVVIEIR